MVTFQPPCADSMLDLCGSIGGGLHAGQIWINQLAGIARVNSTTIAHWLITQGMDAVHVE